MTRLTCRGLLAVLLTVLLQPVGCRSFGPRVIPPDSFDYNQAVAQAAHEQMLLNLVRLRYGETPTFLHVSSVLTQYTYIAGAAIEGAVGEAADARVDSFGANVHMNFAERPTITYTPLRGEEFANQLLTPIPSDLVFSLVQSGWPVDELLTMSVQRINDVGNGLFFPVDGEQGEAFARVATLFIQLALRDGMEVVQNEQGVRVLFLPAMGDDEGQALQREFRDLLGLDPDIQQFAITRRVTDRGPDELLVRVRSLLELMGFLSQGVDVPEAHVAEGRALTARSAPGAAGFPLHIRCQQERPADALIAVEHQGFWFSISHSDHRSKRSFGLLTYLFQLMSPDTSTAAPLLTVAAG